MVDFPPPPVQTIGKLLSLGWMKLTSSQTGMRLASKFVKVFVSLTELNRLLSFPVNGHVESKYTVKSGKWSPPQFVTDPYLRIHGLAPGLNYGNPSRRFSRLADI